MLSADFDETPSAGATCARCGGVAEVMIANLEDGALVSRVYCDVCWRVARSEAGPIMMEGAIAWQAEWEEVEEWLAFNLRIAAERPNSDVWRRLLAHYLLQQVPHLPDDIPPSVSNFLREFGSE